VRGVAAVQAAAAASAGHAEAARAPADDWRRALSEPGRRRVRLWLWAVAAATASVVMVGGITRLTHSGLSMVEWQPIVGVVPPLDDAQWAERFEQYRRYPEYQVRRDMSLGEFKRIFFWEYLHRLLARGIGLVFLVPFLAFWRAGYLPSPLAWRTVTLFACGAAQGVLGWWMVRSGLVDRPSVSHYRLAAHLVLAVVIFGFCIWLARDLSMTRVRRAVSARTRALMARGLAALGVLMAAQIVWGAFVAGLKAGLLFNTFPLMGGRLVPEALLALDPVMRNFVENLATVQWTHRALGTLALCSTAVLFAAVRRSDADRASKRLNLALAALVAAQYLLGIATLILRVPVGLAVAHQGLALAVTGVWVAWLHHVRTLRVS
jgi:cytochrome c oxidase assembly protein subunit 15